MHTRYRPTLVGLKLVQAYLGPRVPNLHRSIVARGDQLTTVVAPLHITDGCHVSFDDMRTAGLQTFLVPRHNFAQIYVCRSKVDKPLPFRGGYDARVGGVARQFPKERPVSTGQRVKELEYIRALDALFSTRRPR